MKSPEKPHDAWLAVRVDGTIVTAHCKCMSDKYIGVAHLKMNC